MLSVFRERPQILEAAREAKFKPGFFIQLLIFIVIFIITQLAGSIPIVIYGIYRIIRAILSGEVSAANSDDLTQFAAELTKDAVGPALLGTLIVTVLVIVYCRSIEKRSLYSMGFVREKAFKDYLMGIVIGFLMFASCVIIALLTGTLKYNGFVLGHGIGLLLVFLLGFIVQGMSEEVLMRGYFMVSIANRNSILVAVLANSIIFALLHLLNQGITTLALVNLTLFGFFASLYTLKMNSIWGISAVHSIWNFAQGNVFGIKVSGIDTQVSLFSFSATESGTLINGGSFGLEGGLAVSVVLIASIILLLRIKGRSVTIDRDISAA